MIASWQWAVTAEQLTAESVIFWVEERAVFRQSFSINQFVFMGKEVQKASKVAKERNFTADIFWIKDIDF